MMNAIIVSRDMSTLSTEINQLFKFYISQMFNMDFLKNNYQSITLIWTLFIYCHALASCLFD